MRPVPSIYAIASALGLSAALLFPACAHSTVPPAQPSAPAAQQHVGDARSGEQATPGWATQTPATPSTPAVTDRIAETPGREAGSQAEPGDPARHSELSDPQIATITQVVNQGEISEGKLASTKARDPAVKNYARMMVKHHSEAISKLEKTSPNLGQAENTVANQLASNNQSSLEELRGKQGREFDKAYMDAMVKGHGEVLELIDNKLIPAAKAPEVKTYLEELRPRVVEHLSEAQRIQQKLAK